MYFLLAFRSNPFKPIKEVCCVQTYNKETSSTLVTRIATLRQIPLKAGIMLYATVQARGVPTYTSILRRKSLVCLRKVVEATLHVIVKTRNVPTYAFFKGR